ncbi:hypothetical protein KC19_10G010900 [Ceratodon purpureus]|uniref:Uncharacterized protein n=1 Tax=Ceratodon purpureus TaxID=3225 RepID=A0A8T0GHZ9_CERPU|nr:hypothetical protein KC19_10G010900 [Ceratodon purpureus]
MVWGMQCGCEAQLVSVGVAAGGSGTVRGVRSSGRQQLVVNFNRRTELFDQLKLRLARKDASILRSNVRVPERMKDHRLHVTAVASEALQDKSTVLFCDVCVNPKVLSPEAAEFMLSVAASQSVLSRNESQDASYVDLTLQGVHPGTFGPVLLVCTTTMFAAAIEKSDVEKALRRAELWRRAVGPSFSVLPVVAGYALPPEIADFAKDLGVLSCDINRRESFQSLFRGCLKSNIRTHCSQRRLQPCRGS